MKKYLPWPDLIGELPPALLEIPKPWPVVRSELSQSLNASQLRKAREVWEKQKLNAEKRKAWADDQKQNCIKPPPIPKICYESQKRALKRLTLQALALKQGDGATFGDIRIDVEQLFLGKVEATGTGNIRGLRQFVDNLWATLDDSKSNLSRWLVSNENDKAKNNARELVKESESRLNRFLIRLGKKLESKDKRRALPDWSAVDKIETLIAKGWCERISVNGELWPPLCCLTYGALAKFLTLCKRQPGEGQLWGTQKGTKLPNNPRTLETAIRRLGLVSLPKGKIKDVEKSLVGQFRFR